MVGKGLAQGLEHLALAGGGVGVFVLVDGEKPGTSMHTTASAAKMPMAAR
jgi:hypothetical protein